ncbi:MAG: hypothetical protein JWQ07_4190 [Ramlibacter sp.]|nr:hypothetical protein [Ramlibacter sp.]
MNYRFAPSALALALLVPCAAWSQVSVSVNIGPPPLLAYVQPAVPGDGYIWTPGYWAWSPHGRAYYWVPGTWVLAPEPGYLWTPGYWAFSGGRYLWNMGYWGTSVGFYGGINYGYGYGGRGYDGGRWNGGVFSYNRAYNNVNPRVVQNVYSTRAGGNYRPANAPHVSFNGGRGGVSARPDATQLQVQRAAHAAPTPVQVEHERAALAVPTQRATAGRGAAHVAATPRPSGFSDAGVVHSRNAAADRAPAGEQQRAANMPPPVQRQAQQVPHAERQAQQMPQAPRVERQAQQVQPPPRVERQAQARREGAQPHAPQADRGQSPGRGEGHGKDKRQER